MVDSVNSASGNVQQAAQTLVQKIFSVADTNGDGTISKDELANSFSSILSTLMADGSSGAKPHHKGHHHHNDIAAIAGMLSIMGAIRFRLWRSASSTVGSI